MFFHPILLIAIIGNLFSLFAHFLLASASCNTIENELPGSLPVENFEIPFEDSGLKRFIPVTTKVKGRIACDSGGIITNCGAEQLLLTNGDFIEFDIAFNSVDSEFGISYIIQINNGTSSNWTFIRADRNGNLLGNPRAILTGSVPKKNPRIVHNPDRNDFLLALDVFTGGSWQNGRFLINGTGFGEKNSLISELTIGSNRIASIQLAGSSLVDEINSRTIYVNNGTTSFYINVMESQSQSTGISIIRIDRYLSENSSTIGGAQVIGPSDSRSPSIVFLPSSNRFLLAFSFNNSGQYDIGSSLLNLDGSPVANNLTVAASSQNQGSPINDITPIVRLSGTNPVLVWTTDVNGDQSGQMDIMARHVDLGNNPLNDITEISATLPEIRKRNPKFIPSTSGFFTIVYEADLPNPGTNIRIAKFSDATLAVTNFGFVNSPASNTEQIPTIAFNPTDSTYMCLWSHDPVTVIIYTSGAVTSEAVTSGLITTQPLTTGSRTSGAVTTNAVSTAAISTGAITTDAITSGISVTSGLITTGVQQVTTGVSQVTTGISVTTEEVTTGVMSTTGIAMTTSTDETSSAIRIFVFSSFFVVLLLL